MDHRPATGSTDWPIALVVTAVAAATMASLVNQPSPWSAWRLASCLPDACFCEATPDRLVRQPANAISSLLFLIPGLVILRRGRPTLVSAGLYGSALVVIGLGSAFYHSSLTFVGQTIDVLGMYLLATFALLSAGSRRFGWSERLLAGLYLAGNAGLLGLLVFAPGLRRYAFAIVILLAIGLELRGRSPAGRQWFGGAIGCLALGFAIWILDITRTVCRPMSWLQGHAIWHACAAAGAALFFVFIERQSPPAGLTRAQPGVATRVG